MHVLLYTRTVYHRTKPHSYSKSAIQKMDEYFSWFYGNSEPVELLGDSVIRFIFKSNALLFGFAGQLSPGQTESRNLHHLHGFLTYHLEIFFDPH